MLIADQIAADPNVAPSFKSAIAGPTVAEIAKAIDRVPLTVDDLKTLIAALERMSEYLAMQPDVVSGGFAVNGLLCSALVACDDIVIGDCNADL